LLRILSHQLSKKLSLAADNFVFLSSAIEVSLPPDSFSKTTYGEQDNDTADIDREYTSNDNPRVILHDSNGFEPGRTDNWDIVKEFIRQRCKKGSIKDQLHVIWLCVETPRTGSRLMQTADEDLLKSGGEQIDAFELRQKAEKETQSSLGASIKQLRISFQQPIKFVPVSTEERYHGFLQMLQKLAKITQKCLRTKETLVSWAVAQRINPKPKVECSLDEGFKNYMKNLGKNTMFKGHILEDCLLRIHLDIIKVWNFRDPDQLLSGNDFLKEMVLLIQPFIPRPQSSSTLQQRWPVVSALATKLGTVFPPLALALGLAGLAIVAIEFLYDNYRAVPRTALCLEAYIVDLTLVLHELFVTSLEGQWPQPLTSELISETLKRYKDSRSSHVHPCILNIPLRQQHNFSQTRHKEGIRDLIQRELGMDGEEEEEDLALKRDDTIRYRKLRESLKKCQAKAVTFKSFKSKTAKSDLGRLKELRRIYKEIQSIRQEIDGLEVPFTVKRDAFLDDLLESVNSEIYRMTHWG
ncbi:hypothetical protein DXG01_004288, partial [Tephrocybe rancida]